MKRLGTLIDRLQLIMTANDTDYRFGKVVLIHEKWLSKRLIAFDAQSGEPVVQMKHFYDGDKKYHTVDVSKIYASSLSPFNSAYNILFLDIE